VVIAFSPRYQDSDEGRIHQTSIGELSLRPAKSKKRKKRKLRKLA